jgi:hypothetical protein
MYKSILKSCKAKQKGKGSTAECKRIAAATTNMHRGKRLKKTTRSVRGLKGPCEDAILEARRALNEAHTSAQRKAAQKFMSQVMSRCGSTRGLSGRAINTSYGNDECDSEAIITRDKVYRVFDCSGRDDDEYPRWTVLERALMNDEEREYPEDTAIAMDEAFTEILETDNDDEFYALREKLLALDGLRSMKPPSDAAKASAAAYNAAFRASAKKQQEAWAFAKLLRKAGTSADAAMPRVIERFNLTDGEAQNVRRRVWGA